MAKKKEPTKLELDMIQCEKAGYGCHYGAWKATQKPTPIKKDVIPEGWRACIGCGKPFKPKTPKSRQEYCEVLCQKEHYLSKRNERRRQLYCDKKEGAANG